MGGTICKNGEVFKYIERRKYKFIYAGIRQYVDAYVGESGEFRANQVSVSYHREDDVIPDTTKCKSEEELIKVLSDLQKGRKAELVSINSMPPQYYLEHKEAETFNRNLSERLDKMYSEIVQDYLNTFIVPILEKHDLYLGRSWTYTLVVIEKNAEYPKDSGDEWINTTNKEVERLIDFACSRLPMVDVKVKEPDESDSMFICNGLSGLGHMIPNENIPRFIETD